MDALMSRFASSFDRRDFGVPILNGGFSYTVTVVIGSLGTNCKFNLEREIAAADGLSDTDDLVIDTGSGNTWIGAQKEYVQTSTSINLNQPVRIDYGSVVMSGNEYSDTVTIGGNIRIAEQSIGVSPNRISPSVAGADGIIGVGPVALTHNTLTNQPTTNIPTVTQNLYTQGTISQELFSLSFVPVNSNEIMFGALTFGTTDPTRYIGFIGWT